MKLLPKRLMGQINPTVLKVCSKEYLKEYEACMKDLRQVEKAREYEKEIINEVTKYLVSHESLPTPSFDIDLTYKILQSSENGDKSCSISLGKMSLKDPGPKTYLETIGDRFFKMAQSGLCCRLDYLAFASIALCYILNQDAVEKLKNCVRKTARLLKQEIDLKMLKYALDDLRVKMSAVRNILTMSEKKKIKEWEKKELVLSLFFPCEEIYQHIILEDGIYQKFSFYTFEIVILFFTVELGLLTIARDEFEIDVEDKLKERCFQYMVILQKYLKLMASQRPKLRIERQGLEPYLLKDDLTGECIYGSQYPFGLLAAFVKSDDAFYYAYKEKFQKNIDSFEKTMNKLIQKDK